MRVRRLMAGGLVVVAGLHGCSRVQDAMVPAFPGRYEMPAVGQVPDSILRQVIRHSGLIVLGTPQEVESEAGIFTPSLQFGAKETWYDVRVVVDSLGKGKLKAARRVDYGNLPAVLTPAAPFGRLGPRDIVVQFPAVTTTRSDWVAAPPLVVGERAVFLFRKCWSCLPITGRVNPRGPNFTADPWVAMGWGSKLPPEEWPRVLRLIAEPGGKGTH
jgi:hypothetical protein